MNNVKHAEVALISLLLKYPEKEIIKSINLKQDDFKLTKFGGELFTAILSQIQENSFNLDTLSDRFTKEVISAYLESECNIDDLQKYISLIKVGSDISQFHIRSHLKEYKVRSEQLAKVPLVKRVFKPSISALTDAIGGYYIGELGVLAGQPGTGKSALALQLLSEFGTPNHPTAYIIHEMTVHRQLDRMLLGESNGLAFRELIELSFMENELKKKDWLDSYAKLFRHEMYIIGSNRTNNYADYANLRELIVKLVKSGVKYIVIDSINLMHWSKFSTSPRHYELERIILDLVDITNDSKLGNPHIKLIAHLSREVEKTADRRPRLNHLGDSSALAKWPDYVEFIYRNPESDTPNIVEVIIAKNRNGPVPSVARLYWNGKKLMFSDIQYNL